MQEEYLLEAVKVDALLARKLPVLALWMPKLTGI
jgi:hypothetical protein